MLQLTAVFLAGLSLFFTGVGGIKSHLQQLSGRRFRLLLARLTDRPFLAGVVGVAFGAVTQSASVAAIILAGMVAAGLISLRRALPVVAASNVGTAVLVFLAAFNIQLAILFLIGVTGLMISFRMAPKLDALLGALFAIGLLFLGLDLMKQAFAPLPGYGWFQALASFLKNWPLAAFFLGISLRMVIQSSSAIGVIAIALQESGLFTEFQGVMLVCGAGPGVALAGLFLGSNLYGPPRQIMLFQGLINLLSGSALAVLFFVSEQMGHSLLFSVMDFVAQDPGNRIAWTFLFSMGGCLGIGLALAPFIEPLLQRMAPSTLEQDLSRPAFLHDEALGVPETAVDLVDKEQLRLYGLALRSLDGIREEMAGGGEDAAALHAASRALRKEISGFLAEMVQRRITGDVASAILSLERRQENLNALMEALHQFVGVRVRSRFAPEFQALMDRLAESLHLIFTIAHDVWISRDAEDLAILLKLTEDRGDMMEKIRRSYQATGDAPALDQSSALFYATTLFERMVWLLRQLGLSLQQERRAGE